MDVISRGFDSFRASATVFSKLRQAFVHYILNKKVSIKVLIVLKSIQLYMQLKSGCCKSIRLSSKFNKVM